MSNEKKVDVSKLNLALPASLEPFVLANESGQRHVIVIAAQDKLMVALKDGVSYTFDVALTKKNKESLPIGAKLILDSELKLVESVYAPIDLVKEATVATKRGYNGPRSQAF